LKNNKNPYVNINNTNNDEGAFGIVKCTEKNIKDLYRLTELFLEIYNILENNEETMKKFMILLHIAKYLLCQLKILGLKSKY